MHFPILASHVCRFWRNAALNAATLWTDVEISDIRLPVQRVRARVYFQRSKSSLLNIKYLAINTSAGTIDALTKVVLNDLTPAIARVRHLTIFAENESVLHPALAVLSNLTAPCLESIRISLPDRHKRDVGNVVLPVDFPLFTGGAPLLRRVQLNSIPCFSKRSFGGLTSLSFRMPNFQRIELQSFLDILDLVSKKLVELTISVEYFMLPEYAQRPTSPIVLPELKSLHLGKATNLPFPNTPCLENLHLEDVDEATMTVFYSRCTSSALTTLLSLKLEDMDLTRFKVEAAALHSLPLVTTLELWNCHDDYSVLRHLEEESFCASGGEKEKTEKGRNRANPSSVTLQSSEPGAAATLIPSDVIKDPPSPIRPVVMPNLRFLATTDESYWLVVRNILEMRIWIGNTTVMHLRRGGQVVEDPKIRAWLEKRDLQYQEGYYICKLREESWVGPDEWEWLREEQRFEYPLLFP